MRYTFEVLENASGFDYNGIHYDPGDTSPELNACQMKDFISAFRAANPNGGIGEATQDAMNNLERECPATPNTTVPQPAPTTPPTETNPETIGGDSAQQQAAPTPPTSGSVDGTSADEGTTSPPAPTDEPTRPPDGEPHPTHGGEQPQEQTDAGDPVDIFNGALYLQETDLEIPNTILPLTLSRFYRSGSAAYGPFGWNWDHNHNLFIRELQNGDIALWRNLHEDVFVFDGADFEPPRGIFERLVRVPGLAQVFEVIGAGGTTMRFERPAGWIDGERIPIIWIKDRHENKVSYSYGADDKLIEVADDDGRFIRFEYDQCGLLVSVFDHSGRRYTYYHNEETQHLVCVSSPPTTDHQEGIIRIYHYEKPFALPELRHNIIRVEDSMGNIYLENKYEQDPASWHFARITEQLYGGFLYQFRYTQLQWVPTNPVYINIPAVRVEVMNPSFGLETYTFNYRGDLLDRRYRLNKDKSFRVVVWQYEFDEPGNLSITTKPDGSQEINTYDFGNPDPRMRRNLLQKELTSASGFPSPSRIVWRGKYESQYQLRTEETDESGATIRMKYDFDLPPAAATTNTGKLMEVLQPDATLPDGSIQQAKTAFEYNTRGQLVAIVLPNGTRNEFRYGAAAEGKGRLIEEVQDVAGLAVVHRRMYDSFGFASETTDGNGGVTQRVHNALGQVEKFVRPAVAGSTAEERYHYNADGHVVRVERPKGAYTEPLSELSATHFTDLFERDVLGFATRAVLSSNTGESHAMGFCNDYRGLALETTTPDGATIKTSFDERRLPLEEEVIGHDGLCIRSNKVYDRAGKLIQQVDAFGSVTRYQYDGFSRLSTVMLPNGSQRKFKWLAKDLLESEETIGDDGMGVVRQLAFRRHSYDEKGRRISTTVKSFAGDPSVSSDVVTTFHYDTLDRVTKIVGNRGGESTRQYDGLGRVVVETDPMGNEEHYVYDNNGNTLQQVSHHKEPGGTITTITKTFEYDTRDRRTAVVEPDGASVKSVYDDRDLVVQRVDRLGVVTRSFYDSFNTKMRQIHDEGGLDITHEWSVDSMSRVTAYTDPTGEVSKYGFDSVGRQTVLEYPNGFVSTRVFNELNQVVIETLGSKVEFLYTFDAANRVTTVVNSAAPSPIQSAKTHEFAYDGLDRLTSAKAGTEEILRKYDSQSRLLSETTLGSTISCRYDDAVGNVEKEWPDGRTEVLSHDLNGVISTITQSANGWLGAGAGPLATFRPSGAGALGDAVYRGSTTVKNTYDERKRVTEIAVTSPAGLNQRVKYRYDSGSLRRVEALVGQTPKTSYFEFDARRRLSLAKDNFVVPISDAVTQDEHDAAVAAVQAASAAAGHEEHLLYDAADARTKHTETGAADKNYTYASGHRVQSDGATTYAHHDDGMLRSDGTFDYEVDAFGRITAVKSGSNIVLELEYDALGRPSVLKEVGEPDKTFNYLGGFVEQENANDSPARQMTLHPVTGVPVAYHSSAGTHYALIDGRFNLLGLLNIDGELVETYRYRTFGSPEIFDGTGSPISSSAFGVQPIFGGQRYVAGPGLYLSKKRLMDPEHGLFLAPDPKGYVDSPMLYAYTAQDPINNIDPNGDIIPFIVAAFVIGGALAGAGYSFYDAYHNPNRYEGASGTLRILGNVFGGALIGGVAVVGGEAILAVGGTGAFATGTTATATSLTATQTFVLYGTSTAATGSILRYGFNSMFPEHVEPVTPGTMAFDYVAGGGIAAGLRALAPAVFSGAPGSTASYAPRSWARFWADAGGEAPISGQLGPYPGRIGALLDRIGIRQGYSSTVINSDVAAGGSWFARTDTAVHEGFHVFVARYFPTFRNLSHTTRFWGAAARYPEEMVAYAFGRVGALRFHGVPFAPIEAFNSLAAYSTKQQAFARWFWGTIWAGGALGMGVGVANAQAPPNEKPPASE